VAFFGGSNPTTGTLGNPDRQKGAEGYDMGGASGLGRKNVNNAPIIGEAVTRQEYAKREAEKNAPPSTLAALSAAQGGAKSAAERQRKRAAAGSTLASKSNINAPNRQAAA
jgi:hypothetical protein